MKNLPKKYIESMLDAQSQIIAQQKEIEQLKEANKILKERYELSCVSNVRRIGEIDKLESENTKLKEAL